MWHMAQYVALSPPLILLKSLRWKQIDKNERIVDIYSDKSYSIKWVYRIE